MLHKYVDVDRRQNKTGEGNGGDVSGLKIMEEKANVIKKFRVLKGIFFCTLLSQGYFGEFLNIWKWLKKYLEM